MDEELKKEAMNILYEMERLDSPDLDIESLTLDKVWSMIKQFFIKIKNEKQ